MTNSTAETTPERANISAQPLAALVDQAAAAGRELSDLLSQTREGEALASKSALHMQDRLRLGARMLKAFQGQIAKVESATAAMEDRQRQMQAAEASLDARLANLDARLNAAGARFEQRLSESTRSALDGFEREIEDRRRIVTELDARIASCAATVDAMAKSIESAEQKMLMATAQSRNLLQEVQDHIVEAGAARTDLSQSVETVLKEVERSHVAADEIRRSIQDLFTLCVAAESCLRERLAQVEQTSEQMSAAAHNLESLKGLLQRLAPWERLLMPGGPMIDGVPEPLAKMADEIRRKIGQDMSWLSSTMRDVAQRVEQLASVDSNPALANTGSSAQTQRAGEVEPHPPVVHVNQPPLRFQTWAGRSK